MADWFYESMGNRLGPISEEDLKKLYNEGKLHESSLVWTSDFGTSWRKYSETAASRIEGSPPPLPPSSINGMYVWIVALLPAIGTIIQDIVTNGNGVSNTYDALMYLCWFAAYSLFCVLDASQIEKSGRNTWNIGVGKWFWIVPVYLFQRARALGQRKIHLYVWIVSLFASVFIANPNFIQEPMYFGVGIPPCDSRVEVGQIKKLFVQIPQIEDDAIIASSVNDILTSYSSGNGNTCSATIIGSDQNNYNVKYTVTKDGSQFYTRLELVQ